MQIDKNTRATLPPKALVTLAVLLACTAAQAQFLDMLKDKASKVLQKTVDTTVDRTLAEPLANQNGQANNGAATNTAAQPPSLHAYQGYDFVPGDTIVFEDNFDTDEDGEFPTHWNQLDGQGAVNMVAGRKAFAMTAGDYTQVSPAIKAAQYLGDAWTIEFDAYAGDGGPHPELYFYNSDNDKHSYSAAVADIRLGWNNWSDFDLRVPSANFRVQQDNPDFMRRKDFLNRWHHFALAFKDGRLKIYVDQFRVYSLADFKVRPMAVAFHSRGDQSHPDVISNVRIANGAGIKISDKKFTDAKIVTHGINFDTDKATIKPESMGTLNMIVDILKNNPEIKFDIQGHTDSSGGAAHNLSLSQQRADAVRQQLISMGVEATRLSAKGLGDTKPIADNGSPEGRANNRRVEFLTIR